MRTATTEQRPRSPTPITQQSTSRKRRRGIIGSSSVNGAAEQRAADATRKARGGTDGRKEYNNQPVGPRNNTRIRAEGVGSSRGSRRGRRRMGGTRGTATRTTQRRGTPRGPSSPFPRRRRWRSPGLFLSSPRRCEDGSGSGGGSRRGRRRMGGTKGTATRTTPRRGMPRGPLSPFPRRRRRRSPGLLLSYL